MYSVKARPLWGGLEALAALVEPVGDVPQIEPALEHLSGEAVVQFNAIMLAFVDIFQEAGSPPETMLAAHYPELADRWRAFSKVVEEAELDGDLRHEHYQDFKTVLWEWLVR